MFIAQRLSSISLEREYRKLLRAINISPLRGFFSDRLLRGLGIFRSPDPWVTLAALAHPGLLSVAAPRLVLANHRAQNSCNDGTAHNQDRRSRFGADGMSDVCCWRRYCVWPAGMVGLDHSLRSLLFLMTNYLFVGLTYNNVRPERREKD
jgi:hypothetical protein